jgi:tyrosyl-tRNA synthetase
MSQSLGNYVGITEEADEMFGKLARVPDELIGDYRLLTLDFFTDPSESQRVAAALVGASADPWSEKRRLAREVVDLYHGAGEGAEAEARFDVVHKERELPDAITEVTLEEAWRSDNGMFWAARVVAAAGLAASNGEARRLIEQGGVRLDGEALADPGAEFERSALIGRVLQVGRRRFVRLV